MDNNLINYYNQRDIWNEVYTQDQKDILDTILRIMPKDIKSVLDVGCGNGIITNNLPQDLDVTGIDISDEALSYVERNKVCGDIKNLPFDNNSYDLVICTDTLEHFEVDELTQVVSEIKRVASKYVLIAVPHKEQLEYSVTKCDKCSHEYHINWHYQSLDLNDLISLMRNEQFSNWIVERYTYAASKWPYYERCLIDLKHNNNEGWTFWDKAVCPRCGSRLNKSISTKDKFNKTIGKINEWKYISDLNSHWRNISPREIIVLFKKIEEKIEIKDSYLSTTFSQITGNLYITNNVDLPNSFHIYSFDKSEINPNSPLCIKYNIEEFCNNSYILAGHYMDWGSIDIIDGQKVFLYKDNNGEFCHAPFILAYNQKNFVFDITYKDISDEVIYIEAYDYFSNSYLRLGELNHSNDSRWKVQSFRIDDRIEPKASGYLLRFICDNKHPKKIHPISNISVNKHKTTISNNITRVEANNYKFTIDGLLENLENTYLIFHPANATTKLEYITLDMVPRLVIYSQTDDKKESIILLDNFVFINEDNDNEDNKCFNIVFEYLEHMENSFSYRLLDYAKKVNNYNNIANTYKNNIDELESAIKQRDLSITDILADRDCKIEELNHMIASKTNEISIKDKAINIYKNNIDELESAIKQRDLSITDILADRDCKIEELNHMIASKTNEISIKDKIINTYKLELFNKEDKINELNRKIYQCESSLIEISNALKVNENIIVQCINIINGKNRKQTLELYEQISNCISVLHNDYREESI